MDIIEILNKIVIGLEDGSILADDVLPELYFIRGYIFGLRSNNDKSS